MTDALEGQLAVVTGGSRGLGLSIATALSAAGADIALLDIRPEVAQAADELAAATGRKVTGTVCDVTDPASIEDAFAALRASGRTATVLVNSAGVASDVPALDVTPTQWSQVMDVNVTGTFLMCQAFARDVLAAGQEGAIVNIASMSGQVVNVPQPQAAYNTSKAAVSMLTKSLAVEWVRSGIRVNAVAPGYFETDMTRTQMVERPDMVATWVQRTPAGRMGQPEELGPLVVYLCSREASFVVGQTLTIDGGYTIV